MCKQFTAGWLIRFEDLSDRVDAVNHVLKLKGIEGLVSLRKIEYICNWYSTPRTDSNEFYWGCAVKPSKLWHNLPNYVLTNEQHVKRYVFFGMPTARRYVLYNKVFKWVESQTLHFISSFTYVHDALPVHKTALVLQWAQLQLQSAQFNHNYLPKKQQDLASIRTTINGTLNHIGLSSK